MLEQEIKALAKNKTFQLSENSAYAIIYSKVVTLSINYFSENEKESKEINELLEFVEQRLGLIK
jgi:hypothetical protein